MIPVPKRIPNIISVMVLLFLLKNFIINLKSFITFFLSLVINVNQALNKDRLEGLYESLTG